MLRLRVRTIIWTFSSNSGLAWRPPFAGCQPQPNVGHGFGQAPLPKAPILSDSDRTLRDCALVALSDGVQGSLHCTGQRCISRKISIRSQDALAAAASYAGLFSFANACCASYRNTSGVLPASVIFFSKSFTSSGVHQSSVFAKCP